MIVIDAFVLNCWQSYEIYFNFDFLSPLFI